MAFSYSSSYVKSFLFDQQKTCRAQNTTRRVTLLVETDWAENFVIMTLSATHLSHPLFGYGRGEAVICSKLETREFEFKVGNKIKFMEVMCFQLPRSLIISLFQYQYYKDINYSILPEGGKLSSSGCFFLYQNISDAGTILLSGLEF